MSELDTSLWLDAAINEAAERDDEGREEQKEKIRIACGWAHATYVDQFLPAKISETKVPKQMKSDKVAKSAVALGVKNPFDDMVTLPPGTAKYIFYGEINDEAPSKSVSREPLITESHPLYPDARPMAWIIVDDSMNDVGYIKGTSVYGVDFEETGARLHDSDLIVVEIPLHSLLGDSSLIIMRRVNIVDGTIKLVAQSTNQNKKRDSITTNEKEIKAGSKIKVLALVLAGNLPK